MGDLRPGPASHSPLPVWTGLIKSFFPRDQAALQPTFSDVRFPFPGALGDYL